MVNRLKEEYKKSWGYVKNSSKYIWVVLGTFIVFGLIGFLAPTPQQISAQILNYVERLLEQTQGFGFGKLFVFIFLNNLKTSFFGLFGGIIFGILPGFISISNGYLLGFVSAFTVSEHGASTLWRLIPHGIFELLAVFVSLGLGLRLGTFFLRKNKLEFLKENLLKSINAFILIVFPLLLIAAVIEVFFIFFV